MFGDIFNVLEVLIISLASNTVELISHVYDVVYGSKELEVIEINLTLFSETPIFSMPLYDLLALFFTIFYTVFFIVLFYKVSKKVIKSIFGVLKWW